jgi:hydrogenase maturation factor
LNTVDEDEARKIFEHLEEMAELEEAAGDVP